MLGLEDSGSFSAQATTARAQAPAAGSDWRRRFADAITPSMLFNSAVFFGFFTVVYVLYLALANRLRTQNLLLLVASYVFYGFWDWRFLSLLAVSTVVDYGVALWIDGEDRPRRRKALLLVSLATNLSILGFFKYFNFFADGLTDLLGMLGMRADPFTLRIILPVGISFYTFQTLSYTIDVYRRELVPTRNLLTFATYVAFFPQLVAGPIERAVTLLPQVESPRRVRADQVNAGLFLIFLGYFEKVVIADNAGQIANAVFDGYTAYGGLDLIVGVLAFTLQIFGDFSGYTNIARGIARLLGFELMLNFRLPYFAHSPSDFWRRWHISLSSWLRDYLYIPLGGNRGSRLRTDRNLMLTMLLGGLWHGAAWTFVIWGAYHGLLLVGHRRYSEWRRTREITGSGFGARAASVALMFAFTVVGWLIFRATSIDQLVYFATRWTRWGAFDVGNAAKLVVLWVPLLMIQVHQAWAGDLLSITRLRLVPRVVVYAGLLLATLMLSVHEPIEFIYFQF